MVLAVPGPERSVTVGRDPALIIGFLTVATGDEMGNHSVILSP
jgi:hypothetical protein